MKANDKHRFDIDALRGLAGERVFARGEAYYRAGQVCLLSVEPARILAQVAGTHDYRTVLIGRGENVGGECSCPAFDDWGFCKHMVATVLAANAVPDGSETEGAGSIVRIRNHLKEKSVDALVEMIVDLAEHDPVLFQRLDIASATAHADGKTIEVRLRRAIDNATRTRGFVDYRDAAGWAAAVDTALDAVADLASGAHAGMALELALRAIDRIERAIEEIDDSDGHCGALLDRARDIHLAACRVAQPDAASLARDLFDRETKGEWGTFTGAAQLYADVLGDSGFAVYRDLAIQAWNQLPPRTGSRRTNDNVVLDYLSLASIMDFFAERKGDAEMRIAIRAKNLSSPWNYLQLAEFCRAQGREDEALRRAEEGLWIFEDEPPDERLVFFAVDLLLKMDRRSDAEAHLWRAFDKEPSLDLYTHLRNLAGETARDRALNRLEARTAKDKPSRWYSPADLLIEIQMTEKMYDAAWATAHRYGASTGVWDILARTTEATHPREAVKVYEQRIEELVEAGGNSRYAEARALIDRMAALRSAAAQTAHIADLKERFRRKRNFMKLLG